MPFEPREIPVNYSPPAANQILPLAERQGFPVSTFLNEGVS